MTLSLLDLELPAALTRAREAASSGQTEAWEALDRHLRWHVLRFVQDRTGEIDEIKGALLDACHWAQDEEREPYRYTWPYLLTILRDAGRTPALAAELRAVEDIEGRPAQMLAILAEANRPMRPGELKDEMEISAQNVSNLAGRLEAADLIVRRSAEGRRATWIFLTSRGRKLAALLPPRSQKPDEINGPRVPEVVPWNFDAIAKAPRVPN